MLALIIVCVGISLSLVVACFCLPIEGHLEADSPLNWFASETPAQAKLRRFILSIQANQLRYDDLEPPLAALAKAQLPQLQHTFRWLGTLNNLRLLRTQNQEYVYELWFNQGRILIGISVAASGQLATIRTSLGQHK